MEKIRFCIIGSGWRSLFYIRVAKALPLYFDLVAVKVRSDEKRNFIEEGYGIKAVLSDEELFALKPEFAVVSVSKNEMFSVSRYYMEKGLPVLAETPGAHGEQLDMALQYSSPVLYGIAEQYFLRPRLSAALALVEKGLIGAPQSIYLSLAHDYHGVSLIRKFLLEEGHPKRLFSDYHEENILGGYSRYSEDILSGCVNDGRRIAVFSFSSGRHAIYDFASSEYHSPLRRTYFRVDGERGYVDQDGAVYADDGCKLCSAPFKVESIIMERDDPDRMQRQPEVVMKIAAGDLVVFENRFPEAALNEDEYAISELLINFSNAIKGRETLLYPAREGLLDAKFC